MSTNAAAKVLLTAKLNSQAFDDRILLLDVPAKIGRSHKEEKAHSSNGYFDCKVLSRQHALLLFEEDQFLLMDTASSNGSFVNNIRLSKTGEESKLTQIYSGDVLRFGSDVMDKTRHVTQKCIVGKIRLYFPDGSEAPSRPPESRLFRPNDTFEDLQAMTQTLQESLRKEKLLEERMLRARSMISKNIGKSHTDLLRLFENIKEELMSEAEGGDGGGSFDMAAYEKLITENASLHRRLHDLEKEEQDWQSLQTTLRRQLQEDSVEIATLRKACQLQKKDLEQSDARNKDLQDELHHNRIEAEEKLSAKVSALEQERRRQADEHDQLLQRQEEAFAEERAKLREQLHNVTSNEINLLNRIKCLEAEEGYSHAEVEKVLIRERETEEMKQELKYKVECLTEELAKAENVIREQQDKVVVERSPEDVARLTEQESQLKQLQADLSYYKQELIDARARKSASDDELDTMRGKVETLENTVASLSNEGTTLKKQISDLDEALEERSREAQHLMELVEKMESSASHEEATKIQISDLKNELANTEATLKSRNEDIGQLRRDLRARDEAIQQREIDISCLRGEVQNMTEESAGRLRDSENILAMKKANESFSHDYDAMSRKLADVQEENQLLAEDLEKQRTLYSELKKMRGMGEELELLHQCQEELSQYQTSHLDYERQCADQQDHIRDLSEERVRLLRELRQAEQRQQNGAKNSPSFGTLRLYEIVCGLSFIYIVLELLIF